MYRFITQALWSFFASTALIGPASSLTPEQDQNVSIYINAGQPKAALTYLTQVPHSAADRVLVEARILKSQGQLDTATGLLRQALEQEPENIFVRRELAHTLFLQKKYRPAKYHIRQLQKTDPDPALQRGYVNVLQQIDRNRPLSFSGFMSFEPSTNANGGSSQEKIDTVLGELNITDESKAQNGVSVTFGGTARLRKPLDQGGTVKAALTGLRQTNSINDWRGQTLMRFSLGYERASTNWAWSIDPYITRNWAEDEWTKQSIGVKAALSRALTSKDRLHFSLQYEGDQNFFDPMKDGPLRRATVAWQRQASPVLKWDIGLQFEHSEPEYKHHRYRGYTLFGGVDYAWKGGTHTRFTAHMGKRDFEGLYPLALEPRDDTYYGVGVTAHFTQFNLWGLSPVVNCKHDINQSTMSLFESTTTGCGLTLTREF